MPSNPKLFPQSFSSHSPSQLKVSIAPEPAGSGAQPDEKKLTLGSNISPGKNRAPPSLPQSTIEGGAYSPSDVYTDAGSSLFPGRFLAGWSSSLSRFRLLPSPSLCGFSPSTSMSRSNLRQHRLASSHVSPIVFSASAQFIRCSWVCRRRVGRTDSLDPDRWAIAVVNMR